MNKIKLIAIDIDGTLLNDKGKITRKVINSIKKVIKKGINVVLCTGRMYKSAEQFRYIFNKDIPIVSYNGALIKKNNITIYKRIFPNKYKEEIFNKIINYGLQPNIYTENELYSIDGNPFIKKYSEKINVDYILLSKKKMLSFLKNIEIIKLTGMGIPKNIDKLIENEKYIYEKNLYFSKSFNYFLEVYNKNINKGNALKIISKKLNVNINETMAIGDNLNDLEMLEVARFPVVMGNGIMELKKKEYFITKTNNENGIAYAISKLIL